MMINGDFRRFFLCLAVVVSLFLTASNGLAEDQKDMGGWEIGSPYNQLYNANELDAFKGWVVKVSEVVPMPGMSEAVALYVRTGNDPQEEPIVVHLCPSWFIDPSATGLKRGDRVKVRGVWVEIDGEDVVMANKVKKGDYFALKVRLTKDGTPFWTMDADTLAKERAAAE
jgi:hypothetical protein